MMKFKLSQFYEPHSHNNRMRPHTAHFARPMMIGDQWSLNSLITYRTSLAADGSQFHPQQVSTVWIFNEVLGFCLHIHLHFKKQFQYFYAFWIHIFHIFTLFKQNYTIQTKTRIELNNYFFLDKKGTDLIIMWIYVDFFMRCLNFEVKEKKLKY